MKDPVRIPTSTLTFDRDSVKDSHKPEDLRPDFQMRAEIEDWFSRYDLDPPFDFVSNLDDVMLATNSVVEQQRQDLLLQLSISIVCKPRLVAGGAGIWCVATLLSCPNPSPKWVVTALSIVAHADQDTKSLIVPADIHSDYSFLGPIARTCGDYESKKEKFQTGLVNLMHALVIDSPHISVMAEKLAEIIDTLVSYLWPVGEHMAYCYSKLLATLETLAKDIEIGNYLVNAKIMGFLFCILEYAVAEEQEIRDDPELEPFVMALGSEVGLAQFRAIKSCFTILDRLRSGSERACAQLESLEESDLTLIQLALGRCTPETSVYLAGARVLARHFQPPE